MSNRLTPAQWLLILVLAAVAVSGWFYGVQWKQVAAGADTTHQEKLLIDLQDQLDRMRAENERLTARIHELEKPAAEESPEPSPLEPPSSPLEPPGEPPPVAQ